jgi:hypothetical protein
VVNSGASDGVRGGVGGGDDGSSGSGNSDVYLVPGQLVVAKPKSRRPIHALGTAGNSDLRG